MLVSITPHNSQGNPHNPSKNCNSEVVERFVENFSAGPTHNFIQLEKAVV